MNNEIVAGYVRPLSHSFLELSGAKISLGFACRTWASSFNITGSAIVLTCSSGIQTARSSGCPHSECYLSTLGAADRSNWRFGRGRESVENHPVDWWRGYCYFEFQEAGYVNTQIYDGGGQRPYWDKVYLTGARFFEDLRKRLGGEIFFAFLKDYYTQSVGKRTTLP